MENTTKTRRQIGDEAIEYITKYLDDAGWLICTYTMFRIDPLGAGKYSQDTAFVIQLGRDIVIRKNLITI